LDKYLKIASHLVPAEEDLHRSTLWHPDLHLGNIFVEDNKIVNIIDWQGCTSLPLFLTCRIPKFLRIDGPLLFDLPPAANLTIREKEENLARYQLTHLQKFYVSKLRHLDDKIFRALSYPHALTRQQLVDFAGSTWEDDGLFLLQEMLHRTWRDWKEITSHRREECPIAFSPEESLSQAEEGKRWNNYWDFFNILGVPMDGWVRLEDFETKVEMMRELAAAMIDSAEDKDVFKSALRAWRLTESRKGSRPGDVMVI
jgi:lysyl-tRNA synthetase class 2